MTVILGYECLTLSCYLLDFRVQGSCKKFNHTLPKSGSSLKWGGPCLPLYIFVQTNNVKPPVITIGHPSPVLKTIYRMLRVPSGVLFLDRSGHGRELVVSYQKRVHSCHGSKSLRHDLVSRLRVISPTPMFVSVYPKSPLPLTMGRLSLLAWIIDTTKETMIVFNILLFREDYFIY